MGAGAERRARGSLAYEVGSGEEAMVAEAAEAAEEAGRAVAYWAAPMAEGGTAEAATVVAVAKIPSYTLP